MSFENVPIKRKIVAVVMLTTLTVLLLTVVGFVLFELYSTRENMIRTLTTEAGMAADGGAGAVAFSNEKEANEILGSLRREPQVDHAAFYDRTGNLFVVYPPGTPTNAFPKAPLKEGFHFDSGGLTVVHRIVQNGERVGMLYLHENMDLFYQRLRYSIGIAALVLLASMVVALALANRLQVRISQPIRMLADTARTVSEKRDYSVRAPKLSGDELGLLTDGFNHMLTRIEEQTLALRESEERLRLALSASGTGTWDWNLETGRITWDDHNAALFGLQPGEFTGTYEQFISLSHPDDREMIGREVAKALEQKTDFTADFRVALFDGTIRHLATRGRALYNADGKPVRMTGVTQDITERKQASETRSFLAAIVESTEDAIIGKDLTGTILTWNRGAERMFGYKAEEMVGRSIELIISTDRPEEEQEILARAQNGETHQYETVRLRKDGSRVDIALTVSPIRGQDGTIVGVSSISRDISERKRAEEALKRHAELLREQAQMLDLANVMVRDLHDRIILWNTGMERMYGWFRSETLGRSSHEILHTQSRQPLEEIKAGLMRDGQWEGELLHTRKDGKQIVVNSQWVLHRDARGQPKAIIEVNTDITERKATAEQMAKMNAELELRVRERTTELTNTNQELEAFTYSVAHDLRAPLRHIDAFTKILFDDFADGIPPEAQRLLESIRKSSQNMSQLVDDLLNLARVGRQELKREHTPLKPVVEEVVADLQRETAGRDVEWHIGELPVMESDPGLMKQVFANLLSNAVKYTRPRKKAVIEIGEQRLNGERVIFVHDNGVGFNMKYVGKLFGVFQRLHRADEFEGTGVGLATVDRIVRKHGGRIWAEAEVDKGATFYMAFNGAEKHEQEQP